VTDVPYNVHIDHLERLVIVVGRPVAFIAASAAAVERARLYSDAATASSRHAGLFRDVGTAKRWRDRYLP
jgi:hypothetical protein